MDSSNVSLIRNQLLNSLGPETLAALMPKLTAVTLKLRQPIYNTNTPIGYVFFPEIGMFSLVANLEDGMPAEVGLIGNEGMLGLSLLSGLDTPYVDAMVQMAGSALRMSAKDFREEFASSLALRSMLSRYSEALNAQIMQTAACNGRHGLEQRLARWLLMAHDRAAGDVLQLTQDFLAMMLAVHRPSVTIAAKILQGAGSIEYAGGRNRVLDRPKLEAASCECYGAVQRRFAVLLP